MPQNYVALLKEHIMHKTLGNESNTLKQAAEKLIAQNTEDMREISQAYDIVHREISGEAAQS
ncbi:hypothetical protein ACTHOQ_00295 [Solibacillus silvestris]|uniref:hypothetical protein n=1 Tax=Solibacillus silvestris TaxID=76853 RepID=UPI003F7EB739